MHSDYITLVDANTCVANLMNVNEIKKGSGSEYSLSIHERWKEL